MPRQLGLEDVDYKNCGPRGQDLHDFHHQSMRLACRLYRQRHGHPPAEEIIQTGLDSTGTWFAKLIQVSMAFHGLPWTSAVHFWDTKFRWIFDPPLCKALDATTPELIEQRDDLLETISEARAWLRGHPRFADIDRVSYSAFTDAQLYYLARQPVVELGCGSGLMVAEILRRKGDAIGIDTDAFGVSSTDFAWTRRLRRAGRLIIDQNSIDRLLQISDIADRTAAIIRPNGGSRWPADALEALTSTGCKRFAFSPWGSITGVDSSTPLQRRKWGVWMFRLLDALARLGWKESADPARPPINPWERTSIWFFELPGALA